MIRRLYVVCLFIISLFIVTDNSASAHEHAGQKTVTSSGADDFSYWKGVGGSITSYTPDLGSGDTSQNFSIATVMANEGFMSEDYCPPNMDNTYGQNGTIAGDDGTNAFHSAPYRFWEFCQIAGFGFRYERRVYAYNMSGLDYQYFMRWDSHASDGNEWWGAWFGDCCDTSDPDPDDRWVLGKLRNSTARMEAFGEVHYESGTCCPNMNSELGKPTEQKLLLKSPSGWVTWAADPLDGGRKTKEVETSSKWWRKVVTANSDIKVLGGAD